MPEVEDIQTGPDIPEVDAGTQTAVETPSAEPAIISEETQTRATEALEKQPTPKTPEKVSGLETLAKNKFKVPKYRRYISAEELEKGITPELLAELKKLLRGSCQDLIIRSAHPQESEFSGGAFESIKIRLWKIENGKDKYLSPEELAETIIETRKKIVELARPENSLQIRRDLKHRKIKDFDPQKMGIYINEVVPNHLQITVVPLDDGTLSIRFNQGNRDGKRMCSFSIPRTGEIDKEILDKLTDAIENKYREHPLSIEKTLKIQNLIREIQRAQSLFQEPQEMEIQLGQDTDHSFVQTKAVNPDTTKPDQIDEEIFEKGIQTFEMHIYHKDEYELRTFYYEKASERDEIRETTSLVINEEQWMKEAGIKPQFRFRDISPEVENHRIQSTMRDNTSDPRVAEFFLKKYEELMRLAEENDRYTLIINQATISEYFERLPWIDKILKMRQQLMKSASVQIRGYSNYHSGLVQESHHNKFGTCGPKQIVITYTNGRLAPELIDSTGKRLLVMTLQKSKQLYPWVRVSLAPLS